MTSQEHKIPGKITVSSKTALELIKHITLSFEGVAALSAPTKKDELMHMLRGGLNDGGIYITKTKAGLLANIYVIVKYGTAADSLRIELCDKIKKELESYLHMKVAKINVHVKGASADGT